MPLSYLTPGSSSINVDNSRGGNLQNSSILSSGAGKAIEGYLTGGVSGAGMAVLDSKTGGAAGAASQIYNSGGNSIPQSSDGSPQAPSVSPGSSGGGDNYSNALGNYNLSPDASMQAMQRKYSSYGNNGSSGGGQ